MSTKISRPARAVALGAIGLGLAAGSYGVASAATGSGSSPVAAAASITPAASTPSAQQPWGHQRSDETLLTGDTATKVRQVALAQVPGGTVVRVETDADGHATYEAHMTKADGTPVTVYVDQAFKVVSVETGMPGPSSGSRTTA
jgi:peptidase YpeB-like protein